MSRSCPEKVAQNQSMSSVGVTFSDVTAKDRQTTDIILSSNLSFCLDVGPSNNLGHSTVLLH